MSVEDCGHRHAVSRRTAQASPDGNFRGDLQVQRLWRPAALVDHGNVEEDEGLQANGGL